MNDSANSIRIDRLSDQNYHMWMQKITSLLALCNLDHCLEDDPLRGKSEPAVQRKWERKGHKARAVIRLSLSDEPLEHVRDAQSAKHMWNAI